MDIIKFLIIQLRGCLLNVYKDRMGIYVKICYLETRMDI